MALGVGVRIGTVLGALGVLGVMGVDVKTAMADVCGDLGLDSSCVWCCVSAPGCSFCDVGRDVAGNCPGAVTGLKKVVMFAFR